MINYNDISSVYDHVRKADLYLIDRFLSEVHFTEATYVLEIGCGTGNYANLLQKTTHAQVYGVDPSVGMLSRAQQKNPQIIFAQSDAEHLPFEDETFDLIYMTDVIHHVPHIDRMFAEICRVLGRDGKVCIVTQSHRQIDNRPITRFFPSTAIVDRARYPDTQRIVEAAAHNHLLLLRAEVTREGEAVILDHGFLELVRAKGYSMLHLIPPEEYQAGLRQLEDQLHRGDISSRHAGETLIWLCR